LPSFLPCAPTIVQAIVPIVKTMFPIPNNGIHSLMSLCNVGSTVIQLDRLLPIMNKQDVETRAKMKAMKIDLCADFLAWFGFPLPNRTLTLTSEASAMDSVISSNTSHKVPKIDQAATSAEPRNLIYRQRGGRMRFVTTRLLPATSWFDQSGELTLRKRSRSPIRHTQGDTCMVEAGNQREE